MKGRAYRRTRLAAAVLALLALEGCLMFERPPAALSCDPDLVDRWIPVPGDQDVIPLEADDYAEVDAQCHVRLFGVGSGDAPEFDALGFRNGDQRYLALDRADLDGLFNVTPRPSPDDKLPDTAVFLVKYRIDGQWLEIATPEMRYVAQELEAKRLPVREVDTSIYLAQGDDKELRGILNGHPALFQAFGSTGRSLRMRRATATERP